MELRRRKLPKPTFPALKKSYLAIEDPHLCPSPKAIVHAKKGLVVSGVRMGEALTKSVAPLCRYPDEGTEPDPRPGLRAFDYDLFAGSSCLHGYPVDAEHLEEFLRAHWGNPETQKGEKNSIEEYRGRVGVILFTSIGSEKKERGGDQAQVRGKAGIALWEANETIGPSYWEAKRILFWELQREGGRSSVVISIPEPPFPAPTARTAPVAEEEEDAPDTEKPAPKKELTELGMYCPNKYDRAPKDYIEQLETDDLRNYSDANASALGKEVYEHAVHGIPGGSMSEREQGFWSGAGKGLIVENEHPEYVPQEHIGGAKALNEMGAAGKLKGNRTDSTAYSEGADSGITNERIWKTISMRSAENASGAVSAFVAGGQATPKNVFASVELPTLLHNDNVKVIHFRNPDRPKDKPITWSRNEVGCWVGEAVPGGVSESNKNHEDPSRRKPLPGFALHDKQGFIRLDEKAA